MPGRRRNIKGKRHTDRFGRTIQPRFKNYHFFKLSGLTLGNGCPVICISRNMRLIYTLLILLAPFLLVAQYRVTGRVTNNKMEPLAFASVEVRGENSGTLTEEDGSFTLDLDAGKHVLIVSMIGFVTQEVPILVTHAGSHPGIVLANAPVGNLSAVVVRGRDRATDIMRNVIDHKEEILAAAGSYSCRIYIKAVQEDSLESSHHAPGNHPMQGDTSYPFRGMGMTEAILHFDQGPGSQMKEERVAVTRWRAPEGLFYLSATQGDFNFYHNLLRVPAVSDVPILSPVSYSGLLAYRFRMAGVIHEHGKKIYVISVKPRQLSNATVEGTITILDSLWVILHTSFHFPKYHLPEYDYFEVAQDYGFMKDTAWMIARQQFTYYSKTRKKTVSGVTTASYDSFQFRKVFPKKYFGNEVSATASSAYGRDSTFWDSQRPEPLTDRQIAYLHYRDSLYTVTHASLYLDSMDRVINRVTWKKALFTGQVFSDHVKQRRWFIPPLPSLYQPFQFGGSRISTSFNYFKTYASRKDLVLSNNLSYGLRNHDVNGSIHASRLYNPFRRSYVTVSLERNFAYIFQGDAWINMLKRSNIYLNTGIGLGHNFEIVNGLVLFTDINMAFRRSVSGYQTNPQVDSLLGNILTNNHAVAFSPYNALYGQVRLQYTPAQRFIREPKEKVILGSKWPTFYVLWKKGIPGTFQSQVDFDYLETGIQQDIRLGLAGISHYTFRTGSFINTRDLRLVDYKFERKGDPLLFLNPNEAFQALDSSFPVFHRFYELHYVHEFNGLLINKIPGLKALSLREIAGGGLLIAPERNLRYAEAFAGLERIFKWPFNPLTKFKLGVYVVGSAANRFSNPIQFKIGITSWDRVHNKWF